MPRKKPNFNQKQKAEMYDLQQKWQSLTDSMKLFEKGCKAYEDLKNERTGVTTRMQELRESGR